MYFNFFFAIRISCFFLLLFLLSAFFPSAFFYPHFPIRIRHPLVSGPRFTDTLQKAFDTVNHSILLRKLNHYGVRGIINDWFASYLVGRQQTTQIGPKNISKKEVVLSGVPQGSALGSLLFLIYINISNSSDKLKLYLFADDTNLL